MSEKRKESEESSNTSTATAGSSGSSVAPNSGKAAPTDQLLYYPVSEKKTKSEDGYKKPVVMMCSVKGGSGKTYNTLSLAFTLTRILNENYAMKERADGTGNPEVVPARKNNPPIKKKYGARVCVIDLDITATNMLQLVHDAVKSTGNGTHAQLLYQNIMSVHEYIVRSARHNIPLEDVIQKLEYPDDKTSGLFQIDFLFGSSEARWRGIFASNQESSYKNVISSAEARKTLHMMLDEVIKRQYDAILIDMQPGMDGLCQAAIDYFTSASDGLNVKSGLYESSLATLFKAYVPHLCFACTTDRTQLNSNMEWLNHNPDIAAIIENKHVIIKDNHSIFAESIEEGRLNLHDLIEGSTLHTTTSISVTRGVLVPLIKSWAFLHNNLNYVTVLCANPFTQAIDQNMSIEEIFCYKRHEQGHETRNELERWAKEYLL